MHAHIDWHPARAARRSSAGVAAACLVLLGIAACDEAADPDSAQQDRIVFASDRDDANSGLFEIYRINVDGTGAENLTHTPASYSSLHLSPDGSAIVFESDRVHCDNVWVMSTADDAAVTQLTGELDRCNRNPRWSPDGTKIAFTSSRDLNWEVYVMGADGSGATNVTQNPGTAAENQDWLYGWSPSGRVLFQIQDDARVYSVNADGSDLQLPFGDADDEAPVWAPNGSKVAFMTARDGNVEIYVMNADGNGVTNLTDNPAADLFYPGTGYVPMLNGSPPDPWSPDGTRIAFMSERDGDLEVYVMNADGTGVTNVSRNSAVDVFDGWSPDGTRILFTSDRTGNQDIYLVNPDGTGLLNLTNSPGNDRDPVWVPRR
jgi:Tol biopolymer transport system component